MRKDLRIIAGDIMSRNTQIVHVVIKKNPCSGAFLSVYNPHPFSREIDEPANTQRVAMSRDQSHFPVEEIDYYSFYIGQVDRQIRNIVLAAFRVKQVGPGDIGKTHVEDLESFCAACIC